MQVYSGGKVDGSSNYLYILHWLNSLTDSWVVAQFQ